MSKPISGKIYTIKNIHTGKMLNLYAGVAENGQNVVQWSADGTADQQWYFDGTRLSSMKNKSVSFLDRYDRPGKSQHNNADVWTTDASNQNLALDFVAEESYIIRLTSNNLCLTAGSAGNGTKTGNEPASTGNVYWSELNSSDYQHWCFTEVFGGDSPTKNYLTYPCKTMNITQNPGDGNHVNYSSGSPADYPIDEACDDSGRSYMYCPCDEMKVVRIYGVGTSGTNTIWLESTSAVMMPSGTAIVTMMVIHPEDDDLKKISVGKIYKRNDAMFKEGKDGYATGNHFHISVGKGTHSGTGWTGKPNNAWVLTTTGGTLKPQDAFYLDPDFTTTVRSSKGITFSILPSRLP